MLRVSGSTAVGPSGTGGKDAKHYSTADAFFQDLDALGMGTDVAAAAAHELANSEARRRFVQFAEGVQIPFEMLEQADIHLFD